MFYENIEAEIREILKILKQTRGAKILKRT